MIKKLFLKIKKFFTPVKVSNNYKNIWNNPYKDFRKNNYDGFYKDRLAIQSDFEKIGNDFKKIIR